MSDIVGINEAISPGSGIVVKTLCADFSDDEPNIKTEGGVGLGEDASVNTEIEVEAGLGGEASNDEEEVDEVNSWNRWVETNLDSLDIEEGYYSNHSSVDGDDCPTQADINRCDDEFRDLVKEYDNIFITEEAEVYHTILPVHNPGLEMVIGMEWPTVDTCRAFLRQWAIVKKH
ncbi:hypothetical protein GIB67_037191 [Kingdonia uniflora]|uniref:Uncharacterized protein n=1 Tax=Kingdonia uniflora TaxID=39325 RepID=A0A7J7MSE8_9MAGN|nr:hypothetical protein GIB67_037191 [Kingdonia uniflora]